MQNAFPLRKTAIFMDIAPIAHKSLISFTKIDKWSILVKEMGGTIILWGSQWGSQSGSHAQHIAPRPAGQYPDISLAPHNPWSAHPKIIIKSQDNYLLGKIPLQISSQLLIIDFICTKVRLVQLL